MTISLMISRTLNFVRDSNWRTEKFDIDLEFGKSGEDKFKKIFSDGDRVEVKTERDIWAKTGNIVIETECRGKPSGISTTQADYWVHQLSLNGEIIGSFVIPVQKLKDRISYLIDNKEVRTVMGGDDYESRLVLLPISKIFI